MEVGTAVNPTPDDEDLVLQDTLQAIESEQIQADVESLQKDTVDMEPNQSDEDSSDSDLDDQPPVKDNDVVVKDNDAVESSQNNQVLDIPITAEPRKSKRLKEKTNKVRFENR
jgi:hypothetical protein